MTGRENFTFDRVSEIIAEAIGVERARIAMNSDLLLDLGVAGDDGEEVFADLDKAFEVDWRGLDLGVHFGNEGLGLPLPWHLQNNCVLYEAQPCRVSDIVQAVDSGRWPGTKVILRPKSQRTFLHLLSVVQTAVLLAIVGGLIIGIIC